MKKVLVVEDYEMQRALIHARLKRIAEVMLAENSRQARHMFKTNPEVYLIMMDFDLGAAESTGADLIREFLASGFHGPIIAMSSYPESNQKMMKAGATHFCDKHEAASLAHLLLKEMEVIS